MCKSVHYLDVKLVVHGVPRCIVFQFDPSSILRVIYEYSVMSKVTRAYPLLVWRVTLGLQIHVRLVLQYWYCRYPDIAKLYI